LEIDSDSDTIIIPNPSYVFRWYAKTKVNQFHPNDIDILLSEDTVHRNMHGTEIGYILQVALGLELCAPQSEIYQRITLLTGFLPCSPFPKQLIYCTTERKMREINENHIRISADFITEGTKIGDLDWQMLLQDNQTREKKYMNFRAEVKFRVGDKLQSKLCSECLEFFDKCSSSLPGYYCIFFSYEPLEYWIRGKYSTENKRRLISYLDQEAKQFIIIDDIQKMRQTVLDIPALVSRSQVSSSKSLPLNASSTDVEMKEV